MHDYSPQLNIVVWSLSRVRLFGTPWTVALPGPSVHGISQQEYRSGLPFPFPGKPQLNINIC